jgi:hypothetical protein
LTISSVSAITNGDFEATGSGWSNPWSLNVNAPAAVSISQDSGTAASGQSSARVTVTQAHPGVSWDAALTQGNLSVVAGKTYTLSFWAKGSPGESIGAAAQLDTSPWTGLAFQTFALSGTWQKYTVTFTASSTLSPVRIQFDLAQAVGTIWIDNVSFQEGDPNLWRRDFTNGTVLLNGTSTAQTVAVGPGYRRIAGSQDHATNNGAAVTSVTIAPQDAILLVKTN